MDWYDFPGIRSIGVLAGSFAVGLLDMRILLIDWFTPPYYTRRLLIIQWSTLLQSILWTVLIQLSPVCSFSWWNALIDFSTLLLLRLELYLWTFGHQHQTVSSPLFPNPRSPQWSMITILLSLLTQVPPVASVHAAMTLSLTLPVLRRLRTYQAPTQLQVKACYGGEFLTVLARISSSKSKGITFLQLQFAS
jgi:hypothetical protein